MTAVPHEGLRRGSARGGAARLIKPSAALIPSSGRLSAAMSAGSASVRSGAIGVSSLAGSIGTKQLRLILAGRRVRLGNGAFVVLILGLLSATLVTLLVLNTALAEGSFALTKARMATRDLLVREQVLNRELAVAGTTAGLEVKARELGMVLPQSPVFLRLGDGKVLGDQVPASAPSFKRPKKNATVVPGGESAATALTTEELSVLSQPPLAPIAPTIPIAPVAPPAPDVAAGETALLLPPGSVLPPNAPPGAALGGEQPLGLVVGQQ